VNRRSLLGQCFACAAIAPIRPGLLETWARRVRARRRIAAHFARSAERWQGFARRSAELVEFLESVEVVPERAGELSADLEWTLTRAAEQTARSEHFARLASFYRRASARPWAALPPRPPRPAAPSTAPAPAPGPETPDPAELPVQPGQPESR
jgi:hypothetical protein